MTQTIPDAAIEAAARRMYPACWNTEPPDALDLRARPFALSAARGVIEAALPALSADRDALQSRIDAALALCDQWDDRTSREIRAVLDGIQ